MIELNQAYLITDEKQRLYYTGYSSTDGYLVLGQSFSYFVIDSRYYYAAKAKLRRKNITVVLGSGYLPLKTIMESTGCDTLGIDFTKTTVTEYNLFSQMGYKLKDISEEVKEAMIVKTPQDLIKIKTACSIAQKALKQVLPFIKEGVTEKDVAAELEYYMKKLGATGTSFETIVAFGKNSAVPHHQTGDTVLVRNMPVLIDFGCVYEGFCSDMTRTFFYGNPTKEFIDAYNAVLTAHICAAQNIVDGTTCVEADRFARNVLNDFGLEKYFTHSLGHGIGVYIHEAPALSPKGQGVLKERMVFSIEPGVYFDGKFGIRIEDSVTIKDGVVHSFMNFKKGLIILK